LSRKRRKKMKRKMTLILIILVTAMASCGPKQEVPLTNFDEVEIHNGFTVDISVGEEHSVAFKVDEDVLEHVEAVKEGDTLVIRVKFGHDTEGVSLAAEVTMPTLTALTVDNGSDVTVSGSGGDFTLSVAGGSGANLANFSVENADVTASGGSEVTVNVSGRLDAEVKGGSRIYYRGGPTLGTIKETDGTIRRK
jgi:hypothetical protein